MAWGNKWEVPNDSMFVMTDKLIEISKQAEKEILEVTGLDTILKAYATVRNRKPTHDPYTNPNAHIYYECGCGEILDPQTKSFAQLNNCASDKGWKIRFTDKGYVPYCVKCGEGVE